MTFEEIVDQAVAMLQRRGRVAYRTLKRQFQLDEDALEDLKTELIKAQRLAADEDGEVLVWVGGPAAPPPPAARQEAPSPPIAPPSPEAERRQLTVLFCDLADSTRLAGRLDPEDLREVVLAYQAAGVEVIQRFGGHIAQYLGDGLLVYFGYPQAHEDDAQRAVRAGLGLLDAMQTLNARLSQAQGLQLAVRIGIHTGPVVVGTMGGGGRHEQLALGETPNLAARLQSLAAPQSVAISATTHRLVQGYFRCDDLGRHQLKGVDTPVPVYRVVGESAAQSRLDVVGPGGLTPLVGRESEVALLRERWAQSQEGLGQVVLLSGEAGIGKSRLVRVLTEQVVGAGVPWLTLRCSPYHTHSAFYPIIDHLRRLLSWDRHATPDARLAALEHALQMAGLPLAETVPLLTPLLLLPVPERYPPLTLSPRRQKQQLQEALLAWLLADAARHPLLVVWEDLHWADPSTLEWLDLLLGHVPTARLLLVLTARPEFHPPWALRSSVTPLTLTRLTRPQVEAMVLRVTGGKPLPAAVLAQVVAKTDGVPLFVEELVKTIRETDLVQEMADRYVLTGPLPPLAIPATLQDALMARLDRLAAIKDVAQLAAVLGREFAYALLRAVAPWGEDTLQQAVARLVEAELLYQRGLPPQATYVFKHALIQDAAYQSLLKSTRQQYHQRIAQVLEAQFPETCATQPERLAQHYTEAGLLAQALPYWQQAGQQAIARSAHAEAVAHLTRALDVLTALPDTPARAQQELDLQTALGPALMAVKGQGAQEVGQTYARARELCQQVGETPQLFPVLFGLWRFYFMHAEHQTARQVSEQCLALAQRTHDPALLLPAHFALAASLIYDRGDYVSARAHLEQGIALYEPQAHRGLAARYGIDLGVWHRSYAAHTLWMLGYPEQALRRGHEALALARELAHPHSLAAALFYLAMLYQLRREAPETQAYAEAVLVCASEQGIPQWVALGTIYRGWALALQGQGEAGVAQIRQGLDVWRAFGHELAQNLHLSMLAEAYGTAGQPAVGVTVVTEALAPPEANGEQMWEAESHRLHGELLLRLPGGHDADAEACFRRALDVARAQQARSWELRTAVSLARLWQRQDKQEAARELLAPVYAWFTEGFDTADLQEARAMLDALA